ncbi:hypothetical protein [uncultured Tateyamaria sp.]|uniref:hypothetical protein n=1 Tax=uncultured Tateyamaria sp. TaxID=455651 RepID=UPI00262B9890|nr:hypothetical protein [uncultured Tateyamaria sp.]
MIEIDNNIPIDDEVQGLMEELLEDFLEEQPKDKPFPLSALYSRLSIKYTAARTGTLDHIIDKALDDWNWSSFYRGLHQDVRYIKRRHYSFKPKKIELASGLTMTTGDSWPDYLGLDVVKRKHMPRDPEVDELVRAKLLKAIREARKFQLGQADQQ